jgi:tRNA(Leu) C34 or U34 (ribose-2'-O)-methylase TrmL
MCNCQNGWVSYEFGGSVPCPNGCRPNFGILDIPKENPMVNYSKIIADTASNHYNVRDEYKDNTVEQNKAIQKSQTRKFSVGAINITGELNIGMMIRSACLMGAENFYIFGRKKFDKRSTVGAENYINIKQFTYDDPISADEQMKEDIDKLRGPHHVFLCEQGGTPLHKKKWSDSYPNNTSYDHGRHNWQSNHPLFLFGSESHGIPQNIVDSFPPIHRLSIPQVGVLRSFNVSAACNIVLWDYCKEVFL